MIRFAVRSLAVSIDEFGTESGQLRLYRLRRQHLDFGTPARQMLGDHARRRRGDADLYSTVGDRTVDFTASPLLFTQNRK